MSPKFRSIAVANGRARFCNVPCNIYIYVCVNCMCMMCVQPSISIQFNSSSRGSLPTTSHIRCIAGGAYPGRHQCIMLCFFFANYICLKQSKNCLLLTPRRLLFQLATHCQHRALTGYVNSHAAALTCLHVTVLCCVVCYKNCSKLFHCYLLLFIYL